MRTYFIAGGAGFIGNHVARALVQNERSCRIIIYDNFSSGQKWHLQDLRNYPALEVVQSDLKDLKRLTAAMANVDVVYHFASNPDIAKALTQPDIDFWEGTYLTQNLLEAMRENRVRRLLYASGSGLYGDTPRRTAENFGPLLPISTYGASKLACEALISAYTYMFDLTACAFRFANVVGPRQTHGVGHDFVRKLRRNPNELEILGDGRQSKSYIYVDDVISAMRLMELRDEERFQYFNVATRDALTVKEIADIAAEAMGLRNVRYAFTGGARGWKGDVPVVRLDSRKLRARGWKNQYSSRQAVEKSVAAIVADANAGRYGWRDARA
jgi:UDP-glucose 4-epimerase